MISFLANADPGLSSDSMILLLLLALAILLASAALTIIPILRARRSRSRAAPAILSATVLWGFLTAAFAVAKLFAYAHWSRENSILMLSGYYDPASAPAFSWTLPLWAILAAVYLLLLAAAFLTPRRF
jgi:heme/copper-type cytochrome/quinol oxidase subunit 3